jgi:predicted XRE-type DNA-binding protein
MPKKNKQKESVFTGSGNVFADLGLPDSPELLRKAELALEINSRIRVQKLTQAKAATLLGIDQPKVSALSTGRLSLFSLETLISYIVALGGSVDVVVKRATGIPQLRVVRTAAVGLYDTEFARPSPLAGNNSYSNFSPVIDPAALGFTIQAAFICTQYPTSEESSQRDFHAYGA